MINLYELSDTQLEHTLITMGQPKFRAKQVVQWVYEKGVHNFEEMTNLPKALRETLKQSFCFGTLSIDMEQVSKDGTSLNKHNDFHKSYSNVANDLATLF